MGTSSNTWVLSAAFGWSGLLIDPSPPNYEAMKKNRPFDTCRNVAVCSQPGTVTIYGDGPVADRHSDTDRKGRPRKVCLLPCAHGCSCLHLWRLT